MKHIFCIIAVLFLVQLAYTQTIVIETKSNKSDYICGEPILLKTTISNKSSEIFIGNVFDFGLGNKFGFSILISYEQEEYIDIMNPLHYSIYDEYSIYKPPVGSDEYFQDRHWIEKRLGSGQTVERLDILAFKKPGVYSLKAVLKEQDGSMRESKPIEIGLFLLEEKPDSISKVGDQDFLIRLGKAICKAHYTDNSFSGFGITNEENTSQEFAERISSKIIEECQDSVFREYVMYADILSHNRTETSTHELINGRKESALLFENEYSGSWLMSEIYRKLFNTYVAEKNVEKAEEYLDKALEKAPNATVLRFVRDNGPNLLDEIRQNSGQVEQPLAKKPLGVVLPVTGIVIAGIFIAGYVLFRQKKIVIRKK
ncbi:MAG: hypothetical protein JW715_03940 [Sedimentisphaerales bacterium]|nr:hypothetical protein [Sedimentisphaerales bacterium]